MKQRGYGISCRYCLVEFTGHAICNSCASGYRLHDISETGLPQLAQLNCIYRITKTHQHKNRSRVKVDTLIDIATGIFVSYQVSTEIIRHVFPKEIAPPDGICERTIEHREYDLEQYACIVCEAGSLVFPTETDSTCPFCKKTGLTRDDGRWTGVYF